MRINKKLFDWKIKNEIDQFEPQQRSETNFRSGQVNLVEFCAFGWQTSNSERAKQCASKAERKWAKNARKSLAREKLMLCWRNGRAAKESPVKMLSDRSSRRERSKECVLNSKLCVKMCGSEFIVQRCEVHNVNGPHRLSIFKTCPLTNANLRPRTHKSFSLLNNSVCWIVDFEVQIGRIALELLELLPNTLWTC